MRSLRLAAVLLLSLTIAGCGGHVADVFKLATASIENPIGAVDIYRARNVYTATLEVAAEYRRYCWSKPYRVLMATPVAKTICKSRREIVLKFKAADDKAFAALAAAETFIAANPTISAVTVVGAAWDAVTAFKNYVPTK